MKKTYISPDAIVVSLLPTTIIAESQTINNEKGDGNILTKEDNSSTSTDGSNVWDDEW